MELFLTIILAAAAYFLGSISFSYIITKKITGKDIRKIEIKNAGSLNVLLNVDKKIGKIVGLLDISKTFVIVLFGEALGLSPFSVIVAASFGVIGHCFPIYYRFYGGKGAASVIGILIYYIPLELIISAVPALFIAYLIRKLGYTPVFLLVFCPVFTYLFDNPLPLFWAVLYLTGLTGIMNLVIIIIKRDEKVLSQ
jgi:glycerol-3-phosphate acyltransferase PlsY